MSDVLVQIHLLDTLTGDRAWHVFTMDRDRAEDPDDPEGWYWTDGSAACDCERMRVLSSVLGRSNPDIPCGDTRVKIVAALVDKKPRPSWLDKGKQ